MKNREERNQLFTPVKISLTLFPAHQWRGKTGRWSELSSPAVTETNPG